MVQQIDRVQKLLSSFSLGHTLSVRPSLACVPFRSLRLYAHTLVGVRTIPTTRHADDTSHRPTDANVRENQPDPPSRGAAEGVS